jgi:PhnB protein
MQAQPYLNFDGRTEEALDYYHRVLGAEVTALMRFKDNPDAAGGENCPPIPPGNESKIMHASFRIGASTLMASDCHGQGKPSFQGFSLSLNPPDTAEAQRIFNALSDGGQVQMPLGKTFFAESFGVVSDKFGLSWMIVVMPA